jgi:outer membrane protein assembly factor BamB
MRFLWTALLIVFPVAGQDNWPRFRGADATGLAPNRAGLPETWSEKENIKWKTEIPGHGWSSPVVWGNRIFITAAISGPREPVKKGYYAGVQHYPPTTEHRWMVYCIDFRTGKLLWEREAHKGVPRTSRHVKNSYASETAVVDGERVYVTFGDVGIFAFDLNGKLLWKKPLSPHRTRLGWGTGSSPVQHGNRLYLVSDNEESSFLAALDTRTGNEVWRVSRDEKTSWSTPYIWQNGRSTEIVTLGTNRIRAYDLDGRQSWEVNAPLSHLPIPSPFAQGGLLYVTSGYFGDEARPVYALKPGASGEITVKPGDAPGPFIAWRLPQGGPYHPSPIVVGDYYFTLFDRGFLTCHDAKTGTEIYGKVRIDEGAQAFTASPWSYNGKLFALSEDGDTFVIEAGPRYKLIRKNSLNEMTLATPAIVRDSLIIRTASKLYRIGQ